MTCYSYEDERTRVVNPLSLREKITILGVATLISAGVINHATDGYPMDLIFGRDISVEVPSSEK
jgi:hypothetical protein